MNASELYRDIAQRTQGDIYIGVVGPVRTGKSTFIKRFMDLLVIPGIENEHVKERLVDELPQSGSGKTIMTTQPRFVPNEAMEVTLDDKIEVRMRMVDCVGYMVEGALGHTENDVPRMVRTPWFDHEIPFEDAAEIGTRKVTTDHSTICIVMTTDGSMTGIDRAAYTPAEERVIAELKELGKPFALVLNTVEPRSEEAELLRSNLSEKYDVPVIAMDVLHMSAEQVNGLLESVLMEFPINTVQIELPSWVRALGGEHWLTARALESVRGCASELSRMRDYEGLMDALAEIEDYMPLRLTALDMGRGLVTMSLEPKDGLFYKVLSEECGVEIDDDYELMSMLREFSAASREFAKVAEALAEAQRTGYGMVPPVTEEMQLLEPEIVQQGSRFGVRLRAKASGLHIIRVDIDADVSPLVGTEQQSEEFMNYLLDTFEKDPAKIWNTNIFGKPLHDLVCDSVAQKVNRLPDNVKQKMQLTLERMVNNGCNNVICIML
ncbi:MAG: stage IV sporulation protein A [Clostridia bacterium]|nr:stage IV sporulation protein A [Clostridia bacterium]